MNTNIQTLISKATAIVNKVEVTKSEIYTLLDFIENLQIFGDEERVNQLLKARKVMIPSVRDYFKHNGFEVETSLYACDQYGESICGILSFVDHVLKNSVSGIVFYKDIEERFYEVFNAIYENDIFYKIVCTHTKKVTLKKIQTMIEMISYSHNCKNVKFEPAYPKFTCSVSIYNSTDLDFKMEYSNGVSEEIQFNVRHDVPTFARKVL